jgi:spermidine/putrescine transport system ATP-binding protein
MTDQSNASENVEKEFCLELRNLVKRFGNINAVNRVTLKIRQREIFSILGPSGCGKTTLLRLVAGLESADEGDILIDRRIVNDIPPYKRDCSIVFQHLALFPHMSVWQNIAFGLERKRMAREDIHRKVRAMLKLMQLDGMEHRRPMQLSGGQQQRVALARSLILRPKILLLDEPLASLDRKLRKEMQVELKRIQKEIATTFLYVTHDQKVALSLSDRIGVMCDGKIVQIGTSNEIYESPKNNFIASFMGATNIFLGKVCSVERENIQFETHEGLRIIARAREGIPVDDVRGVSVHPEAIELLESKEASYGENTFKGRIREVFYQGDFTEITIVMEKANRLITAYLSRKNVQKLSCYPDKEVLVQWSREYSNLLVE